MKKDRSLITNESAQEKGIIKANDINKKLNKARPIEKDKSIITDEMKSHDKKKIKHNIDKSRLIGERQSNLNKQDKHTTEGNFTPMISE